MASFFQAIKASSELESGYLLHCDKIGGEFYCGIPRYPTQKWIGWVIIDSMKKSKDFPANLENVTSLSKLVEMYYMSNYWDLNRLGEINNQRIANRLFDIGISKGVGYAAKALQNILNLINPDNKYYPDLKVDGKIGAGTITAINKHPNAEGLLNFLNLLQGAHDFSFNDSSER